MEITHTELGEVGENSCCSFVENHLKEYALAASIDMIKWYE